MAAKTNLRIGDSRDGPHGHGYGTHAFVEASDTAPKGWRAVLTKTTVVRSLCLTEINMPPADPRKVGSPLAVRMRGVLRRCFKRNIVARRSFRALPTIPPRRPTLSWIGQHTSTNRNGLAEGVVDAVANVVVGKGTTP